MDLQALLVNPSLLNVNTEEDVEDEILLVTLAVLAVLLFHPIAEKPFMLVI